MENSVVDSIKKLTAFDYVIILYSFLATLAPGFLVLYLYKPTFIENLESVKLFVFSFCLTVPVLLINSIAVASFMPKKLNSPPRTEKERDDFYKETHMLGSVISFLIFYTILILAYFLKFNFKMFLTVMLAVETVFLMIGLFVYIRYDMKQQKNNTALGEKQKGQTAVLKTPPAAG